eukprot:gene36873-27053_t
MASPPAKRARAAAAAAPAGAAAGVREMEVYVDTDEGLPVAVDVPNTGTVGDLRQAAVAALGWIQSRVRAERVKLQFDSEGD